MKRPKKTQNHSKGQTVKLEGLQNRTHAGFLPVNKSPRGSATSNFAKQIPSFLRISKISHYRDPYSTKVALPIFLTRGFKQNPSPATHAKPPRADRRELVSFSRFRQKLFSPFQDPSGQGNTTGQTSVCFADLLETFPLCSKKNYCTLRIGEEVKRPSKGAKKFPLWEMFGKRCPLVQSGPYPRQKEKKIPA